MRGIKALKTVNQTKLKTFSTCQINMLKEPKFERYSISQGQTILYIHPSYEQMMAFSQQKVKGRSLTPLQIVEARKLSQENPWKWTPKLLAKKFGVKSEDVIDVIPTNIEYLKWQFRVQREGNKLRRNSSKNPVRLGNKHIRKVNLATQRVLDKRFPKDKQNKDKEYDDEYQMVDELSEESVNEESENVEETPPTRDEEVKNLEENKDRSESPKGTNSL